MRSHITFRTVTQSLDDAIKWNNLPRHWPFVRGIHLSHHNDANDAELWYLFWSAPEQMAEQTFETPSRSLWRHWSAPLSDMCGMGPLIDWNTLLFEWISMWLIRSSVYEYIYIYIYEDISLLFYDNCTVPWLICTYAPCSYIVNYDKYLDIGIICSRTSLALGHYFFRYRWLSMVIISMLSSA